MKKLIVSLSFLFLAIATSAQSANDTIVIAPGVSGFHFYHVIKKGETIEGLSQQFDVPKKQLVETNHTQTLKPFQIIKIPINKADFVQAVNTSSPPGLKPLYHKVSKGETLYRIGKLYNDIPVKTIQAWNNLPSNNIQIGQYLIIGYLKTRHTKPKKRIAQQTPVKKQSSTPPKPSTQPTPQAQSKNEGTFLNEVIHSEKQRIKKEKVRVAATTASETTTHKKQVTPLPFSKENKSHHTDISPIQQQKKETQKNEKNKSFESLLSQIPNQAHKKQPKITEKKTFSETSPQKRIQKPVAKIVPQTNENSSSMPETVTVTPPTKVSAENNKKSDSATLALTSKSAFLKIFLNQTEGEKSTESRKGAAGWFRSNIKPGSTKYYALCDSVPRGTVVKVINPINQKYIFAKVLASIPPSKENYNLIIKLSDAAMRDLGTQESRFWSKIEYPKSSPQTAN